LLKAIPTHYRGYHFRSRLEARWAVFFDALGLKWEYEPEGFELPSGRYLPDFFVHIQDGAARGSDDWVTPVPGYWVEIKGAPPTVQDLRMINELTQASQHRGMLAWGLPDTREWWETYYNRSAPTSHTGMYNPMKFFLNCLEASDCGDSGYFQEQFYRFTLWKHAVRCAKGARFERGESGSTL
jgi:hypothetical protein